MTKKLLPERVTNRIIYRDGHYLWTGPQNSAGYAEIYFWGQNQLTHRVVWELLRGPTPARLVQVCGVRRCVNIDHIQPEEATT